MDLNFFLCICLSRKLTKLAGWRVGTGDFDAQMCGIKFWNGDENLRPVYKNNFSKY